jgi:hypothetical protein
MADITFNVREAADAESFVIYNTGSNDVAEGDTLTIAFTDVGSNPVTILDAYTLLTADAAAFNSADGWEIDVNFAGLDVGTVFKDGIYLFTIGGTNEGTWTEGFAAEISESVMVDSLGYRIYQTSAVKDYINEKIRILNNLRYAAQIGATDKFLENLEILQRME